jgi:hypothetical protein
VEVEAVEVEDYTEVVLVVAVPNKDRRYHFV